MVKKSQVKGIVLILVAIGLYFFAQEHNPNMGFGDMLRHLDGWRMSKPVYYLVMISAALLGVVGAVSVFNGFQKNVGKG
jgi:hypothetical protein